MPTRIGMRTRSVTLFSSRNRANRLAGVDAGWREAKTQRSVPMKFQLVDTCVATTADAR